MKIISLPIIALSTLVIACNAQSPQYESTHTDVVETVEPQTERYSEVGQQTVEHVIASYIELKDAFVATDTDLAKNKAKDLLTHIDSGVNGVFNSISNSAKNIILKNDVEQQRAEFEILSKEIYKLIKTTKSNSTPIYKQYCPMAFNNIGAFWLSTEEKIMNPYFGDRMLRCGKVDEILTSSNN